MATFKIEGMEEAIKMIKDVGELPQKCVTKAAKKGIQIAKKDAKGGGWVDETGYLRKSIKEIIPGKNIITKYLYILTSGLVFAGMHLLGQVTSTLDYLFLIPYGALGVAFAALYHKTDNIFSTMMMHSLHNTATIILYFTIGGI